MDHACAPWLLSCSSARCVAWMMKSGGRRHERSNSRPLPQLLRKGKTMYAEQIVADMADDVLARQAAARARWSGESFGEALGAVLRTEAGRQLQDLRDGVHGSEKAKEWQENLVRRRAEERVALITARVSEKNSLRRLAKQVSIARTARVSSWTPFL